MLRWRPQTRAKIVMKVRSDSSDIDALPAPMSPRIFAELYSFYLPQVKAFLARAGCDGHSLDDLAQEAFLRAWNGRGRFLGTAQFRTWLLGIARNTARESWRKRKPDTLRLEHDLPDCTGSQSLSDPETAQTVRDAIGRLPSKQRIAISLVYLNGFTQIDAASKANCTHDAFRRRLASGRTNLRKLLRQK